MGRHHLVFLWHTILVFGYFVGSISLDGESKPINVKRRNNTILKRVKKLTGETEFLNALNTSQLPVIVGHETLNQFKTFIKNQSMYKDQTLASKSRKLDGKIFKLVYKSIYLARELVECIYAHNYLRRMHNLSELLWDPDLAYRAEQWAMILATRDKGWQHSMNPDENGLYFGENVYEGYASVRTCVDAVWLWYSEIEKYNYDDTSQVWNEVDHFLQIVWPTTKYIGVGLAYGTSENTYIVAQYMDGVDATPEPISEPNGPLPSKDDMTMDPKPLERIVNFRVNISGGWTTLEPVTYCSVSSGKGIQLYRRYCIDRTASSQKEPAGCDDKFPRERVLPCHKNDCPEEDVKICNDLSEDCGMQSKSNCMEKEHWETMKNCKKTCNFCRPCVDTSTDCSSYATQPYNFCTDIRYRDWMLVYCSKSCSYCEQNVTTIYDTDCIDYHPDCNGYANEYNLCMSEKYGLWMSVYCKRSCKFCKKCENTIRFCGVMATLYDGCTHKNYRDLMLARCPKECNYCYEPQIQSRRDIIQPTFIKKEAK